MQRLTCAVAAFGLLLLSLEGCAGGGAAGGRALNPPSNAVSVTLQPGDFGAPVSVAYESSKDAQWALLPSGASTFDVAGEAYGIAWICSGDPSEVYIYQATIAENNNALVSCGPPSGTATISGTMSQTGYSGSLSATIYGAWAGVSGGSVPGSYTMSGAVPASQDVYAFLIDDTTPTLEAFKSYPSVSVSGSTTQNINFTAADAVGSPVTVTAGAPPAGETAGGVQAGYCSIVDNDCTEYAGNLTSTLSYPTIAGVDATPDGTYLVESLAESLDNANLSVVYSTTPPTSLSFTPAFTITVTPSDTPVYDLSYSGFGSLSGGSGEYGVFEGTSSTAIVATVTSGYVRATGSAQYTLPDITLSGYPTMTISSGSSVSWEAAATYGSPVILNVLGALPFDTHASRGAQSQELFGKHALDRHLMQNSPLVQARTVQSSGSLTSGSYYAAIIEGMFNAP